MGAKKNLVAVLVLGIGAILIVVFRPSSNKTPAVDAPIVSADTPIEKLSEAVDKKGPKPLDELVRDSLPSVAIVKGKVGHGSGFMLPQSILATNAHVVALEFEENIRVHFPSAPKGRQGPYKAKFIWADKKRDLAFLEVNCDVEALELAEDYKLRPGQEVFAIGSPGLAGTDLLPNAPVKGQMSAMHKLGGLPFYALSMSVNPGNSGGPVLDMNGRVLGMITAKAKDKDGIAFAIPLDDLYGSYHKEVMAQGREAGPEMTVWLRACTVFERLIYLGEEYAYGLDTYTRAMEVAFARGGSPADGLRLVTKEMESRIKVMNALFADNLEKNLRSVVDDVHIVQEDRQNLYQLWLCCREMRTMFDQPRGTLDAYRNRKEQLKKQYQQLITAIVKPRKPKKKSDE